jgi:hypothetical protein
MVRRNPSDLLCIRGWAEQSNATPVCLQPRPRSANVHGFRNHVAMTSLASLKGAFDFVFGVLVRMLVTLPVGWFIYAFGFAAKTCDSLLTAQCLTFALGAPIGYLTRLGLASEEPPDYPEVSEVWLIALVSAIAWMAIDVGLGRWRRKEAGR